MQVSHSLRLPKTNDRARLSGALVVSAVLHVLLLMFLSTPSVLNRLSAPPPPSFIDVDLAALPPPKPAQRPAPAEAKPAQPEKSLTLPDRQIVSPPEAGENKPPEATRLLSDRDTTVIQQTVKRGEPAPGEDIDKPLPPEPKGEAARPAGEKPAPVKPAPARKPARPQPPPARAAAPKRGTAAEPGAAAERGTTAPSLDELLPGVVQMARQGYGAPAAPEPTVRPQESAGSRDLIKQGGGGRPWAGRGGSLDFLPDVREGDITLLNTKAELFAPFVRRVGVRVFGHFVILLRRELTPALRAGREVVLVEAVMTQGGELVSIGLKERSSAASLGTDRSLQRACQEGFFDRNPPPGAETGDGNIHFLFGAEVMMIAGPGGQSVGYQALFTSGLL